MVNFSHPNLTDKSKGGFATYVTLLKHRYRRKSQVFKYLNEAEEIIRRSNNLESITDEDIKSELSKFSYMALTNRLISDRDSLQSALANLLILSARQIGMRPYSVQVCCALAMIDGYLVQLAPGEGKTLTIGLAATVIGWSKKPCFVITTNDYLAQRDLELLRKLYNEAGVSAAVVTQDQSPANKKLAYSADVVYGTAKQMLADYLGDIISLGGLASRMRMSLSSVQGKTSDLLMRGLHSAIVDEADSVLIDEATTPLIISAPEENSLLSQAVLIAMRFVDSLVMNTDYVLQSHGWEVSFTAIGEEKVEAAVSDFPALWQHRGRLTDLLTQAILAKDKFKLDEHFVVVDGKVVLIDESTGRMMHGRSWSYGMHQAVEARAGVELTSPSKTMEKMSFQAFFKSFHHLTGASGTLQNIQAELYQTYQLKTLEIPTRLPTKLDVKPFKFYCTKEEKIEGLLSIVCDIHSTGQPVLIGTRRIRDTEELAIHLEKIGLSFDLLNAKKLEQEAEIIAQAGQYGQITLSTNMAGRGTDIPVPRDVLDRGGLVVVMYEPHDSARIDWQLFGRAGRQGNAGSAYPLVSAEDPTLRGHLNMFYNPLLWLLKAGFQHQSLVNFVILKAQQSAQNKAFRQRRQLVKLARSSQERMSFVKSKTEGR